MSSWISIFEVYRKTVLVAYRKRAKADDEELRVTLLDMGRDEWRIRYRVEVKSLLTGIETDGDADTSPAGAISSVPWDVLDGELVVG